jgi:uncharacterized protein
MSDTHLSSAVAFAPGEKIPSLEVVYKISERCNLACSYCYFFFRGDETYKDRPPLTLLKVAEALGAFISEAVSHYNFGRVNIVFHGGEPLMMPTRRFSDICTSILSGYSGKTPVNLALQTNAALINAEWLEVFQRFDIGVGVSFDGPKHIHDLYRVDTKGAPSYDSCRRGWDMLMEAHAKGNGKPPAILCVINPATDADEVFNHFVDTLQATLINFLEPTFNHDDAVESSYVAGLADYMIAVFKNWAHRKTRHLSVRFLRETLTPLANADFLGKAARLRHDVRNQVSVSSTGELFPEDTIKILPPYRTTDRTVFNSTFSDLLRDRVWTDMTAAVRSPPGTCRSCDWLRVCNGGRLTNRYRSSNGFDNPSVYCSGLKRYYEVVAAALVKSGVSLDVMRDSLLG